MVTRANTPNLAGLPPARPRPGRRGVILVDVIVGTVILGVAFAVLLGILSRAIDAQSDGERLQTASMLLDEQLNLVLVRGPDNYAARFATDGPCDAPFEQYHYQVQLHGGSSGLPYDVTATVSWRAGGRDRSVAVATRIAPRLGDDPDPLRTPDTTVERSQ